MKTQDINTELKHPVGPVGYTCSIISKPNIRESTQSTVHSGFYIVFSSRQCGVVDILYVNILKLKHYNLQNSHH